MLQSGLQGLVLNDTIQEATASEQRSNTDLQSASNIMHQTTLQIAGSLSTKDPSATQTRKDLRTRISRIQLIKKYMSTKSTPKATPTEREDNTVETLESTATYQILLDPFDVQCTDNANHKPGK